MNLRFLKLFPDQVARYWNELGPMIEMSLPPTTSTRAESRMTNVLQALLSGRLEMFQYYDQKSDDDNSVEILGFTIIAMVDNIDFSSKDMLIYSVFAYQHLTKELIFEAFQLIVRYAKSVGCTAVIAYTMLPNLVKYIKSLGGQTEYTFLRLEV